MRMVMGYLETTLIKNKTAQTNDISQHTFMTAEYSASVRDS